MRKLQLKELELKLPVLDLSEAKSLMGGYGDWHEHIDTVYVDYYPDERPAEHDEEPNEYPEDPRERENDEPQDDPREDDRPDNDRPDDRPGDNPNDNPPDEKPFEPGECPIEAATKALANQLGISSDEARAKVEEAMRKHGMNPDDYKDEKGDPRGIQMDPRDWENVLNELFDQVFNMNPNDPTNIWCEDGYEGIAFVDEWGHMVNITGYDDERGMYQGYDITGDREFRPDEIDWGWWVKGGK